MQTTGSRFASRYLYFTYSINIGNYSIYSVLLVLSCLLMLQRLSMLLGIMVFQQGLVNAVTVIIASWYYDISARTVYMNKQARMLQHALTWT